MTPTPPSLTELNQALTDAATRWSENVDQQDALQNEIDRLEQVEKGLMDQEHIARRALTLAVLERAGAAEPSEGSWYRDRSPLAVVREGEWIYAVLPGGAIDGPPELPRTLEDMADRCVLAVLHDPVDDTEGGGQ